MLLIHTTLLVSKYLSRRRLVRYFSICKIRIPKTFLDLYHNNYDLEKIKAEIKDAHNVIWTKTFSNMLFYLKWENSYVYISLELINSGTVLW